MDFWEEDHGSKVSFHISCQGDILQTGFLTVDVDTDHQAQVVFVGFLH